MILLKTQNYLLLKRITEHWKMWHQSQIAQDLQLSPAKEFKTLELFQRQIKSTKKNTIWAMNTFRGRPRSSTTFRNSCLTIAT